MAVKIDLVAPNPSAQEGISSGSALRLHRWLKYVGDRVIAGEPLVELVGNQAVVYVHAPGNGTLSAVGVIEGQNILSGTVLGHMSVISKEEIDWGNMDQVTGILEDFADKSKDFNSIKDANDALGQLLGIDENPVFSKMNTEEQNLFLQNVVDQYQSNQLKPDDVARKLLEGLELRTPQYAPPQGPSGPSLGFGMRGPGPSPSFGGMGGGMGGGYNPHAGTPLVPPSGDYMMPPQQPQYYPPNHFPPHYPPQHGDQQHGNIPQGGYPQGGGAIPQPNAYPSYPVSPTIMPDQNAPASLYPPSTPIIPPAPAQEGPKPANPEASDTETSE